jgi:MFS family permease
MKKTALKFVVLLGAVSLFADMTYEGARSITGPYLAVLGASATAVGIVAGFGELAGYALRLVSGYLSDRTKQYWAITIVGYVINLFAVPALALAGNWPLAAGLMITERIGKAVRTPARDAMLSHATTELGRGWGFGLHEALDQMGAVIGPLIVAAALYFQEGYQVGFAILLLPAILAVALLIAARLQYPEPRDLEKVSAQVETRGFSRAFWVYLAAVGFLALGFADFPLIAYHFEKAAVVSDNYIPFFYAAAMAMDAFAAIVFGHLFDRIGFRILVIAGVLSAFFAPLVFLGGFTLALFGVVLWGIGMGAQESVMRAAIADMVPADKRGSAYGLFNMGYGVMWFLGSALMGVLYDVSLPSLITFSVLTQLISIPILFAVKRQLPAATSTQ